MVLDYIFFLVWRPYPSSEYFGCGVVVVVDIIINLKHKYLPLLSYLNSFISNTFPHACSVVVPLFLIRLPPETLFIVSPLQLLWLDPDPLQWSSYIDLVHMSADSFVIFSSMYYCLI